MLNGASFRVEWSLYGMQSREFAFSAGQNLFTNYSCLQYLIVLMEDIQWQQPSPMVKELYVRSQKLLAEEKYTFVREAVDFLRKFMNFQDFGKLYVSFNGGKDATAVLFLTLMAMQHSPLQQQPIKCIYFREPNPFEEMNQFVEQIRNAVSIEWEELSSRSFQEQLTVFCSKKEVKYIVMGSRKDDQYCGHLGLQTRSDVHKGYPDFQRLNPIIFWTVKQVWTFLNDFGIPYCSLYKSGGYTSLGNRDNTQRNMDLYDENLHAFKPAWQAPSQTERNCRVKNEVQVLTEINHQNENNVRSRQGDLNAQLANRIQSLENEVQQLRTLIMWMKCQLQKKGILQL